MGHNDKDCHNDAYDEDDQELGWGTWLKASPLKGRIRDKEEVVAITTRRKALFVIKETGGIEGQQEKPKNSHSSGAGPVAVNVSLKSIPINNELHESGAEIVQIDDVTGDKLINVGRDTMGALSPCLTHGINDVQVCGGSSTHINEQVDSPAKHVEQVVHQEDLIPLFNMGLAPAPSKGRKGRKKGMHGHFSSPISTAVSPMEGIDASAAILYPLSADNIGEVGIELSGKRKAIRDENMDVVEGGRVETKKHKVTLQDQDMIQVAEVGHHQPREEQ